MKFTTLSNSDDTEYDILSGKNMEVKYWSNGNHTHY